MQQVKPLKCAARLQENTVSGLGEHADVLTSTVYDWRPKDLQQGDGPIKGHLYASTNATQASEVR